MISQPWPAGCGKQASEKQSIDPKPSSFRDCCPDYWPISLEPHPGGSCWYPQSENWLICEAPSTHVHTQTHAQVRSNMQEQMNTHEYTQEHTHTQQLCASLHPPLLACWSWQKPLKSTINRVWKEQHQRLAQPTFTPGEGVFSSPRQKGL